MNTNQTSNMVQSQGYFSKYSCYLISFITLLLSTHFERISNIGIFFVLLLPLCVIKRLKLNILGLHSFFLILAFGFAFGYVIVKSSVSGFFYFFGSVSMWCIFLCGCVYHSDEKNVIDFLGFIIQLLLMNYCQFFCYGGENAKKKAKYKFVRYIFCFVVALTFLVLILCLIFQADIRMSDVIYLIINYLLERMPIVISCLILAFIPAAFIYGFIYSLSTEPCKTVASKIPSKKNDIMPWFLVFAILTIIDFFFFGFEMYCSFMLVQKPDRLDYNFYDIFAVLILIMIGVFALAARTVFEREYGKILYYLLVVSNIGLLFIAGYRIFYYIYYFGLWEDRIFLCILLMGLAVILGIRLLFTHNSAFLADKNTVGILTIFVLLILIVPRELIMSEINTAIFLHKYNLQQLEIQKTSSWAGWAEVITEDLDLKKLEQCGIDAIPAFSKLIMVDDIFVEDQTIGEYAYHEIINLISHDINFETTGNILFDMESLINETEWIPRYRLPSKYALARLILQNLVGSYDGE